MWHHFWVPTGTKPTPGPLSNAVAGILRAQKGKLDVTNEKIANAAAISASQLGEYLNGKKRIDIEELDQVCYALGLDMTTVIRQAESETDARRAAKGWPARPLA